MMSESSMVTVLTGPTAGGKSAQALALAGQRPSVIINADASQLYADLAIITARPGPADMAAVPHRLYGVLDGNDVATAAQWAEMAKAEIAAAHAVGRHPIIVGGTGMYIATLIDGIAPVPAIPEAVRQAVRALTPADAQAALAREDPAMAARLKPGDRQRIARALEVVRATGHSLAWWQQQPRTGGIGRAAVRGLVVDRPRPELHARAEARLDAMLAGGALAEVARLVARGLPADRPVLRALGVPELASVLAGSMDLAAARAAILHATRQYQKRQQTWARQQCADWERIGATISGERP
jgi:tRNA dimethylallyltransferase